MKVSAYVNLFLIFHIVTPFDFEHKPINEPVDVYFDAWGYVRMYSSQWKFVTYINMEPAKDSLNLVKQHSRAVFIFCETLRNQSWYQYTDCPTFKPYVNNKIKQVENLKNIVADYTESEPGRRRKRAVLEFVGKITKILFGTLDSDDANYYTTKINELEQEQRDFIRIIRDQILVVKSAITSSNFIMRDVQKNEKFLKDGLLKLTNHVNNLMSNAYAET